MDQDFHYYGTYYAARVGGGLDATDATLVGKAANFIDFLSETAYAGYWKLVRESRPKPSGDYTEVGEIANPRYTFQGGLTGTGVSPEDGLWCSYHFMPGNYADPAGTPSPTAVHGFAVARELPAPPKQGVRLHHELRDVKKTIGVAQARLLNRPQSPLSRALLADTHRSVLDADRLEAILKRAIGASELLPDSRQERLRLVQRFGLILLGVRAHVIADTWAHQDFSGISHEMNTYYDVNGSNWGRQSIDYQDVGGEWKNVVLSSLKHDNLKAVPNGTSYLGHGWMGHFPDYSFAKFRYRPWWRDQSAAPIVRDNPGQYRHAFLELCSLMSKAGGREFNPSTQRNALAAAQRAIVSPCEIAKSTVCPRAHSAVAWQREMQRAGFGPPDDIIDAKLEPDPKAVLPGMVVTSHNVTRYGTYVVCASSDLYLFQIAADYHFHFVRHYLRQNGILNFTGSWSTKLGPLANTISDLFEPVRKAA